MTLKELQKSLKVRRIIAILVVVLIVGSGFIYARSNGMSNSELYKSAENYLTKPNSNEIARELNQYRDPTSALEESLMEESEQNDQDDQDVVEQGTPIANSGGEDDFLVNSPTPVPESESKNENDDDIDDNELEPAPSPITTPEASDEPTPTTSPSPAPDDIITASVVLQSGSEVTADAIGEVEVSVVQNENGYWDFILEGIFENLQPNSEYQVWLCNEDCSSHKSARFTTDDDGVGELTDVEITHETEDEPTTLFRVWEVSSDEEAVDEDEPTTCYQTQDDSPACLVGELDW